MNLSDTPKYPGSHIVRSRTFIARVAGCDICSDSGIEGLYVVFGRGAYQYTWPQIGGRNRDSDWDKLPEEVRTFVNAYVALHQ